MPHSRHICVVRVNPPGAPEIFVFHTCIYIIISIHCLAKGIRMKYVFSVMILFSLVACNSVYVKPNSIDATQTFYADRGGYSMKRSVKEALEQRGYNVVVGTAAANRNAFTDSENIEIDTAVIPKNVRYIVKVSERREKFNPFWCPFNGFWWWNFNMSIADQETGVELMTWRGRACQNSALRMFNDILDEMEGK